MYHLVVLIVQRPSAVGGTYQLPCHVIVQGLGCAVGVPYGLGGAARRVFYGGGAAVEVPPGLLSVTKVDDESDTKDDT